MDVLVVDDDPLPRRALARLVRMLGHRPIEANGAEALELLGSEPIDVVVSDYDMPDVDGPAVLAAARSSGVAFVFHTGNPVAASLTGAPVLAKPTTLDSLREALEEDAWR